MTITYILYCSINISSSSSVDYVFVTTRITTFQTQTYYQFLVETIEKIKRKMVVPARPSIEYASCFPGLAKLAENCWKDDPDERPSFASIKKTMSSLTR